MRMTLGPVLAALSIAAVGHGCGGAQHAGDECYRSIQSRAGNHDPLEGMNADERYYFAQARDNWCTSTCNHHDSTPTPYTDAQACNELGLVSFEEGDLEDAGRNMWSACYAGLAASCDWLKAHPDAQAIVDRIHAESAATTWHPPGADTPPPPAPVSDDPVEQAIDGFSSGAYDDGYHFLYRTRSAVGTGFDFKPMLDYAVVVVAPAGTSIVGHVERTIGGEVVMSHDLADSHIEGVSMAAVKFMATDGDALGGVYYDTGGVTAEVVVFGGPGT